MEFVDDVVVFDVVVVGGVVDELVDVLGAVGDEVVLVVVMSELEPVLLDDVEIEEDEEEELAAVNGVVVVVVDDFVAKRTYAEDTIKITTITTATTAMVRLIPLSNFFMGD